MHNIVLLRQTASQKLPKSPYKYIIKRDCNNKLFKIIFYLNFSNVRANGKKSNPPYTVRFGKKWILLLMEQDFALQAYKTKLAQNSKSIPFRQTG